MLGCFKIEAIEYGWFGLRIGSDGYAESSDYLGYDFPKKLLHAVWNVLQNDVKEEYIYIMGEPGAELMCISCYDEKVAVELYALGKNCDDLRKKEEDEKNNCGECLFRLDARAEDIVDGLVSEFYLYENGNGRDLYEAHWGVFPDAEYAKLKKLAVEMSKKISSNNRMYSVDMLCPERTRRIRRTQIRG